MYLAELKIWNFRKYGGTSIEGEPSIVVNFKEGLNLLVGENDCGKTTIIDAVKHLLGTQSYDFNKIEEDDFYVNDSGVRADHLKIEGKFKSLSDEESGNFLEWISFDETGSSELIVRLGVKVKNNKILTNTTAGVEGLDTRFEARDLLRVTYLKPLRDAESELTSGYKSRLAQILRNHPLFDKKENEHTLEKYIRIANSQIKGYFEKETLEREDIFEVDEGEKGAKIITQFLDTTLSSFMGVSFKENNYKSFVDITRNDLLSILRKLSLNIHQNKIGLGSLNQLFIAMELLLFEIESNFNLALIEEIEAHLHPQAQLRLIEYLQDKGKTSNEQYLITTHSITLSSKVKLENVILCRENSAFPLGSDFTQLSVGDYQFIERFLDSTKANLFFAKGVILVEGDAENLLIPILAEIINKPLHKYGVSLVNVGSTAFIRYSKIFRRKNETETLRFPVSIVTDLDVKPLACNENNNSSDDYKFITIHDSEIQELEDQFSGLDLEVLKNNQFLSIDKAKRAVLKRNNLVDFNGFRGFQARFERKITQNYSIDVVKQLVKYEKNEKYGTDTIKVYLNEWTMEYDIALSGLKIYMYCAIKISKKIKSDEDTIGFINLESELARAKKDIEEYAVNKSNEEIAYWIYEDLYKNRASKAVAAQYLGELLKVNKEVVKPILETDQYIKYLLDSIKHVCRGEDLSE
ncbi:ATP-dependent nuclease [Peribacillus frigoritolerans]|uniref:AAA family ATPase n=1 Tax=Peribacillus castrilensis TaxID=2897690 RepID=A0AAW9NE70_9BACI|nr:AAA family ATPase [Peribacillus castrilensis]